MNRYLISFSCGAIASFSLFLCGGPSKRADVTQRSPAVGKEAFTTADHSVDSLKQVFQELRKSYPEARPDELLMQFASRNADGAAISQFYELLLSQFDLHGEEKQDFVMGASLLLFGSDPFQALEWAARQPKELQSNIYRYGVLSALDHLPLSDVISLSKNVEWQLLPVGSIASRIAEKRGINDAIKWIESNSDISSGSQSEIEHLIGDQLKLNKESLFQLSDELLTRLSPEMIGSALGREVKRSPGETLAWLNSLDDSKLRTKLYPDILKQIAEDDAELALKQSVVLEDDALVSSIAEGWARRDWKAAYDWYLSSGKMDDAGLIRLFEQGAYTHSSEVAESFKKTLDSRQDLNPLLAESARRLAVQLYDKEPQEAKIWISSLPNGNARDAAITQFATKLATDDVRGASEWLRELDFVPDGAIVGLVGQIEGDLRSALAWTSTVADEQLRQSLAEQITSEWFSYNSALTLQEIQESSFDGETQEHLRTQLSP